MPRAYWWAFVRVVIPSNLWVGRFKTSNEEANVTVLVKVETVIARINETSRSNVAPPGKTGSTILSFGDFRHVLGRKGAQ